MLSPRENRWQEGIGGGLEQVDWGKKEKAGFETCALPAIVSFLLTLLSLKLLFPGHEVQAGRWLTDRHGR